MKGYIKKDDALTAINLSAIENVADVNHNYARGFRDAAEAVRNIPDDEDVEVVIRCKNCKYQEKGENELEAWNMCGFRPWLYVPTNDEHFCGNGKRRDEV